MISRLEKETIIRFNEQEKIAVVFTYNGRLKRKLYDFTREYPDLCSVKREIGDATEFEISKDRLKINPRAPLSEEQRKRRSDLGKQIKSAQNPV